MRRLYPARARAGIRLGEFYRYATPADSIIVGPRLSERTDRSLAERNRACRAQLAHDRRIGVRYAVAKWFGAPSGRNVPGVEEVLEAVWNPMQRAEIDAPAQQSVRRVSLGQRALGRDRRETFEFGT